MIPGAPTPEPIRDLDHLDELVRDGRIRLGDYWRLRAQLVDDDVSETAAVDTPRPPGTPDLLPAAPIFRTETPPSPEPALLPDLDAHCHSQALSDPALTRAYLRRARREESDIRAEQPPPSPFAPPSGAVDLLGNAPQSRPPRRTLRWFRRR
ncbi:hypothetical protein KEM60_01972 [Austwickia sp. TVS 96-490-7B]|uniref:hypothetical protein n=1 Tax=Austwickia sp. TVS 96-490-7B TaxID=2830843 RepID=UPI001C578F79|nr:hypothetical protein [Austwickia sp. TVS 96-490-7B]MBW3085764.1 hypothetical protein [Austwickia sp. TVS 96-490-7B]